MVYKWGMVGKLFNVNIEMGKGLKVNLLGNGE